MMSALYKLAGLLGLVYFVRVALAWRKALTTLRDVPGKQIQWLNPVHPLALVIGSIWPNSRTLGSYYSKFTPYGQYGSTCLSAFDPLSGKLYFWLADAEAIKVVTGDRHTFQKPSYEVVDVYGKSLLSTEGAEWKRHRAVVMPSFNEANNALVWTETIRLMREWFGELDVVTKEGDYVLDCVPTLSQLTLLVVSAAGFGIRTSWSSVPHSQSSTASPSESSVISPSQTQTQTQTQAALPFSKSLITVINTLSLKVLAPVWLYTLPLRIPWLSDKLDETREAYAEFRGYMLDIVASARDEYVLRGQDGDGNGVSTGRKAVGGDAALLRNLVKANMEGGDGDGEERGSMDEKDAGGKKGLTDDELLSNVFTFLLAGHETSANTLSFALVLIALHPEVQQKMYEESMRVWPGGSDLTSENFTSAFKDDFPKFEYTLATFRETLRLFPVETRLPKVATSDTKLTGRRFSRADLARFTPDMMSKVLTALGSDRKAEDGSVSGVLEYSSSDGPSMEKFEIAIPKGSSIQIDCYGVHRNPMYWGTDCKNFKPERFIDTETYRWPRDAFLGFSAGARGCIGARFALTEGICILALLVRRFEILPPPEVMKMEKDGKGWEERFKWMTRWTPKITIRPVNARVELRKRV